MKVILLIIIAICLVLIGMKWREQQEQFTMNSVDLNRTDLLDSVQSFAGSPSVNIVGGDADDTIITNFIQRQLGEQDIPTSADSSTSQMLSYPEEPIKEVGEKSSLEDIEQVKMSYENEIIIKRNNQKIKLNNILLELKKIKKLETKLNCER
jgi:hypothetical protein